MQLTPTDYVLWGAGTLLRIVLCFLLLRHRLYLRLPFFSSYLLLSTARTFALWWVYHDSELSAQFTFNIYWVSQLTQVMARGLAAAEICWFTLHEHRGIWALSWRLLAMVGAVLVVLAGFAVLEGPHFISPVVMRAERGLELTIVGLLVTLFSLCRYYGIVVTPGIKALAFGLGLYAAVQTLNNTIIYFHVESYFPWYSAFRTFSFDVALLVWCWGLRKPAVLTVPAPAMLPADVYGHIAPQVNYRLRQLNDRLLEMLK